MKRFFNIFFIVFILLLVSGCGEKIIVKEDLTFEINSILKYKDLVEETDSISVLDGDETVDTSKLGKSKVIIKYLLNDNPKYKTIEINVIDTVSPVITYKNTITTTKGKKINLLDGVKADDNSKEKISVSVSGNYDINKVGDYKLQYIASDSSGNATKKDFTLSVKNVSVKIGGYYMYKSKKYWEGIQFKKNNKVVIRYNVCPGEACGYVEGFGTYTVKDTALTIQLSYYEDESGKEKTKDKYKCTISDENTFTCNKLTYKWNSKFK